jgi:hypothetical protein
MKAEADRSLSPQDRHLMSQGKSSSSSEARLRTRNSKIETRAQRIVTMTVTVRPARKNFQPFSTLWRFEQGQDFWVRVRRGMGLAQRTGQRTCGLCSGYLDVGAGWSDGGSNR